MIVAKEKLLNAVEVLDLVPSRPGITSSEFIRIDKTKTGIKLSLASEVLGTVEIKAKGNWPCKSPFFIDRRLVVPFLMVVRESRSKSAFEFNEEEIIKRKKKETVLQIRQGRRVGNFTQLPTVSGYGTIVVEGKEVKFTDAQKALIACAQSCSTPDPAMPQLNCVYVTSKGLVLAYNQIAMFAGQTDKFKQSIPFPLFLLSLIGDKRQPKIRLSNKRALLEFDEGTIVQTLPPRAVDEFPVDDIVSKVDKSKKYPVKFTLSAARLSKVLERFSQYMGAIRKQDRIVRLTSEEENKLLLSTILSHVSLHETMKVEGEIEGKIKCDWALDLVIPVINFLAMENAEIEVRYDDKKKTPYYLSTDDITLVIARKA